MTNESCRINRRLVPVKASYFFVLGGKYMHIIYVILDMFVLFCILKLVYRL